MKRAALCLTILGLLSVFAGCKAQSNDTDNIRSGINEHLASLKTINLSAMDMNIQNISVQGNQAHAQVEFRPKTGAPQGAGMQVNYDLQKQDGKWIVQNSKPAGGMIQHPDPGQNPHTGTGAPSTSNLPDGNLPDFRNLVGAGSASGAGPAESGSSLPAGHPQVNAQGTMPPQ
jgi:hypothetical protein